MNVVRPGDVVRLSTDWIIGNVKPFTDNGSFSEQQIFDYNDVLFVVSASDDQRVLIVMTPSGFVGLIKGGQRKRLRRCK